VKNFKLFDSLLKFSVRDTTFELFGFHIV